MADYLPLTALKVFEATARHCSFVRAARELHVTPGAVSQQIKSLEDLLGVKLFHRLHRRLELTDAARQALPKLSEGFASISDAVKLIRSGEEQSMLRIWAPPSFASRWLVPRLKDFTAAYPEIELSVSASIEMIGSGHSVEMMPADRFYQKDIDMGIFFGRGDDFDDYQANLLMGTNIVPLCSPALLEDAEHPLKSPDDLRFHRLIHDDTAYEGRLDWEGWLREARVEGVDADHGLRFNQVTLALKAATDGQGVVLGIQELAQNDIDDGRLVIPFGPSIPMPYDYYVISLADNAQRPYIKAFRDWVLAQGQAFRSQSGK